jgi:hypothetical protein
MAALGREGGNQSAASAAATTAISEKIYQSGGTALAQAVLVEHLISPETAEANETAAALEAARVLDCVASCGSGLSPDAMRQVLDMATAHLFVSSGSPGA